jgi:hypothetical protein
MSNQITVPFVGVPAPASGPVPWIQVPAGSVVSVPSQVGDLYYAVDSSGLQVTFNFPGTPAIDGQLVVIKLAAASVSSPVLLVAGAATTIEDPNALGTFSSIAGTVHMSVQGALFGVKFQISTSRWIQAK